MNTHPPGPTAIDQESGLCVWDNVCDLESFTELRRRLNDLTFAPVHVRATRDYSTTATEGTIVQRTRPLVIADAPGDEAGTPFGFVIQYARPLLRASEKLIGKQGDDWRRISVSAWRYGPGAGLALHQDGSGSYTGAFVFFFHENWRFDWGGLLVICEGVTSRAAEDRELVRRVRESLRGMKGKDEPWEAGIGRVVVPRPNRLVLIRSDVWHAVTKVSAEAPTNRLSVTGMLCREQ